METKKLYYSVSIDKEREVKLITCYIDGEPNIELECLIDSPYSNWEEIQEYLDEDEDYSEIDFEFIEIKNESAILYAKDKQIMFKFKDEIFYIDLTEGDLHNSWNTINTKDGECFDVNFSWDDADKLPSFAIYEINKKTNETITSNFISINIIEIIGTKKDYFGEWTSVIVSNKPIEVPTQKYFPNGFSSWQETHYEIVQAITIEHMKDEPQGVVKERHDAQGHGGLYELAEELTDKYEELHKDDDYIDGHFFDEIEEFIKNELFPKNN